MIRFAALTLAAGIVLTTAATPAQATPAQLPHRTAVAASAAAKHGMTVGLAVVDTKTGKIYVAGGPRKLYRSASVVKVLIATRLLLEHHMTGRNVELARRMITGSDNDAAETLYSQVGRDALLPWLARHYHLPRLGTAPTLPGYWGTTQIRARGLAWLYMAIRNDPVVWPWLGRTMHQWQPRSVAGEPNDFGLGGVDRSAAVKNGWVVGGGVALIHTTGYVGHDRYAVVLLGSGPTSYYYTRGEHIITRTVRILMKYGALST